MSASFWTMERIDQLFDMIDVKGHTFGQVALAIGCTRNAAIGKYTRVRYSRGIPAKAPRKAVLKPVAKEPRKPKAPRPSVAAKAAFVMPKIVILPPPIPTTRIGIVDLTGCKFAIAEDPELAGGHAFCNAAPDGDHPYCAYHCKVAHFTPSRSKRAHRHRTIPTSLLRAGGY